MHTGWWNEAYGVSWLAIFSSAGNIVINQPSSLNTKPVKWLAFIKVNIAQWLFKCFFCYKSYCSCCKQWYVASTDTEWYWIKSNWVMDSKKRLKTGIPGKERNIWRKSEKELRKKQTLNILHHCYKRFFSSYFLSQEIWKMPLLVLLGQLFWVTEDVWLYHCQS